MLLVVLERQDKWWGKQSIVGSPENVPCFLIWAFGARQETSLQRQKTVKATIRAKRRKQQRSKHLSSRHPIRLKSFCFQLYNAGYRNLDALDGSAKMVEVAKRRNIYHRVICDYLGPNQLRIQNGEVWDSYRPEHWTQQHIGHWWVFYTPLYFRSVRHGNLCQCVTDDSCWERRFSGNDQNHETRFEINRRALIQLIRRSKLSHFSFFQSTFQFPSVEKAMQAGENDCFVKKGSDGLWDAADPCSHCFSVRICTQNK